MNVSEKLKLIRKHNNLTQEKFANSIGTSRANLANIELGKVEPTKMFINVVSLRYNVDKHWLEDESNSDVAEITNPNEVLRLITEKYKLLDDKYKTFVEDQINSLLKMQESPPETE